MTDSDVRYITHRFPLIEARIDRAGCQRWAEQHGLGRAPKSACIVCPNRRDRAWRDLEPDELEEAYAFDEAIRAGHQGGGQLIGEAYLHRKLIPLREVDLRSAEEKGQGALFDTDDACGGGSCWT